jgi:DNA-binding NarL/FixJ family response regulator
LTAIHNIWSITVIRVLVCESRDLVLSGLRSVFGDVADTVIVGHVPAPRAAGAAIRRLRPDVVLVSVDQPTVDPADVRALLDETKGAPPVVLIASGQDDGIIDVLLDGARGALLVDSEPADIVGCVRAVAGGGAMLAPPIAARLIERILESPEGGSASPTPFAVLSDREREVLSLLAEGRSHVEIAGALSISQTTVRSHLHHVVTKLHLRHRAQAVALAYQVGLVGGP